MTEANVGPKMVDPTFVHVELLGEDCHCASDPEARFPTVSVTLFPLHMVLWLATGAGMVLVALVSVMSIS